MTPELPMQDHSADFTEAHYRGLLRRAKAEYRFIAYDALEPAGRVILWRHDLDYSVHRALALARIESEEGVLATYFIHLHNEFYHWGEKGIADKLREIRKLGHRLGLHFDPSYYLGRMQSEADLVDRLAWEKRMLEAEFGEIKTFSFHNPDVGGNWLQYDADEYAGMANAYGRTITKNFTYCSDSNGYWRFKRLADVLAAAEAPRLQVLTHPGWWQEKAMAPRERIFRTLHGRFRGELARYDAFLDRNGRTNIRGKSQALGFLKASDPAHHAFLDDLWNQGRFETLFLELFRLVEGRADRISEGPFREELRGPAQAEWSSIRELLNRGHAQASSARLETGCLHLCGLLEKPAKAEAAGTPIAHDEVRGGRS